LGLGSFGRGGAEFLRERRERIEEEAEREKISGYELHQRITQYQIGFSDASTRRNGTEKRSGGGPRRTSNSLGSFHSFCNALI
jgi:hypothetical protein